MLAMKNIIRILVCVLAGFTFWIPSIIIHAISGHHFGELPFGIMSMTILSVALPFVTLHSLAKRVALRNGIIALLMLLGIWIFGPLGTLISASFSGGGFTQPGSADMLRDGILLFVPYTFMMSTYDGSLVALIIATVAFIIKAIISLTKRSTGSA
jgi:hypothetical protein